MGRLLAASDIHGHGHLLEALLAHASYSPASDRLYLLGDYVNKGPDSVATVRLVLQLQSLGAVVLAGNNDRQWLAREDLPPDARALLPHLREFPLWAETDEYLFVHAGIRPGVPMDQQAEDDLLTIRAEFHVHPRPHEKTVVFGHTPVHDLDGTPGRVWIGPGKIGIDTGAGHGIALSLVDLTGQRVHSVSVQTLNTNEPLSFTSANLDG